MSNNTGDAGISDEMKVLHQLTNAGLLTYFLRKTPRRRNDLLCVERDVKLYSLTPSLGTNVPSF